GRDSEISSHTSLGLGGSRAPADLPSGSEISSHTSLGLGGSRAPAEVTPARTRPRDSVPSGFDQTLLPPDLGALRAPYPGAMDPSTTAPRGAGADLQSTQGLSEGDERGLQ